MAAGTKSFLEQGELLEDHSYGILRVVQLDDNRLLNLRNPWGQIDWKGAWSPNSE